MTAATLVRGLRGRLALSDFSPANGPLARRGLVRRAWPFVIAGLVARAVLQLPGTTITDGDSLWAARGLTIALLAATVIVPWQRLPLWWQASVPFGFLGVIALLRESTGGVAGFAVLVMLPVLWLALYGTRGQLLTSIVLSILVFLVPILAIGAPTYPASSISRILLWPVTAAIVGGSTYRLVSAERSRAAFVSGLLAAATEQSIIATDPDGLVTVFNSGAERLFGYRADEMIGRTTLHLHDPDEVAERAAELGVRPGFEVFAHQARQGRPETREWTYIRKDGTPIQAVVSVAPIQDGTRTLRGFVKIGSDVTERATAARLKDEFIALVSHELRTPLSSIIGYLEVLFDEDAGPLTSRQRKFLDVIDRNARRQLRLVSDLLFMSQADAGRVRLSVDDVDVAALAGSAVEAARPHANATGVELRLDTVGDTLLRGDPDRLGQIFDNLLTNAIKFTPDGGEVCVRVAGEADEVLVEVSDTGIGVPLGEQGRLFTRFFRSAAASSRAIPGIGLGLTIVKAIAEAHHGTVSVTSVEGHGTTFHIALPRTVE
ncbi:MAG TPA: ATP-binding protein [Jatrophihabitans sp.]|nr:ATP-binding protein [Jatrophihabitans sp.]